MIVKYLHAVFPTIADSPFSVWWTAVLLYAWTFAAIGCIQKPGVHHSTTTQKATNNNNNNNELSNQLVNNP